MKLLLGSVIALLFARSIFLPVISAKKQSTSTHSSNWAVILSSSRYWFNYRHTINGLSIYKVLRNNGFDDDHIILMLADEYAVNARNPFPNTLVQNGNKSLYDQDIEIDYRGEDVTAQHLVQVLTGAGDKTEKPVLKSDRGSNVLIYWTGHGGDQFFKFQDTEEIMATDIASVFRHMYLTGMYNEILFLADTCQAFTLGDKVNAPNVTIIGSSLKDESSYAIGINHQLGVSLIERYTSAFTDRIEKRKSEMMSATIQAGMVDPFQFSYLKAHVGLNDDLATRKASEARISDFFSNVASTGVVERSSNLYMLRDQNTDSFIRSKHNNATVHTSRYASHAAEKNGRKLQNREIFKGTCHDLVDTEPSWTVEPISFAAFGMVLSGLVAIYGMSRIA